MCYGIRLSVSDALVRSHGSARIRHHKAKGVSDTEGDKKAASGHKTDAMVQVYDRKLAEVKPEGKE